MCAQTMASGSNIHESHGQLSAFMRQNSLYHLTLNEVENQLGTSEKPLGSMNLDELLQNVWNSEENPSMEMLAESTPSASFVQRQASLTLAKSLSGKTVDQIWGEIQQGQNKWSCDEIKNEGKEPILGEITLEDFLVKAGLFAEPSLGDVDLAAVNVVTPQSLTGKMALSKGTLSETMVSGQRMNPSGAVERSIDRRLRRKIKNRESAARSRARKQAYHNELVSKVSRLEEENIKLKKEKEFEKTFQCEPPLKQKYQLRRTSSTSDLHKNL